MPTKGQILVNPDTGDTYEFLETGKETNGERITIKTTLINKGEVVPNHIHLLQDETFEVISGTLKIWANKKNQDLTEGEKLFLPKNQAHNHYNGGDSPVVFIQTISPALDFDYFVENLLGLAMDGKFVNGKAGLIQELVTLKYLDSKIYLSSMPIGAQKALMNLVAPVGRLLGYRAIYQKYTGIEK